MRSPPSRPLVAGPVHVSEDGRRLSAAVDSSAGLATAVVRALDAAGVLVDDIEVRQPSLDDVFFSLTGRAHRRRRRGRWRLPRRWRHGGSPRAGRGERHDDHHAAAPRRDASRPRPGHSVWRPVSDVWSMTRRNLVHISREPMQLSDVTIQPVLFTLLFVYIFGGGHPHPRRRQLHGLRSSPACWR